MKAKAACLEKINYDAGLDSWEETYFWLECFLGQILPRDPECEIPCGVGGPPRGPLVENCTLK